MIRYRNGMARPKTYNPEAASARAHDALSTGADFVARTIYLIGEIETQTFERLIVALRVMDESLGDIKIVMNSVGGLETDGYAIHDALKLARNRIVIEAYGACQSIAAIIMQAGDHRLMSPESQFMIHHGIMTMGQEAQQDAIVATAKRIEVENKRYHRILAQGSGLSMEAVRDYCRDETFFDAKDAVRLGFADAVIRRRKHK